MYILVLNSGSSSLKYQLFDFSGSEKKVLAKGLVEQIGEEIGKISHSSGQEKQVIEMAISDHQVGLSKVVELLCDGEQAIITNREMVEVIGHRVVHGGDRFAAPTIITDEVLQVISECSYLAPLHNPANITGIKVACELFPKAKQVGVFDTAFHQSLPDYAYLYAIPYELYSEHKIRRYGFHGTSHLYVAKKAAEFLSTPLKDLNMITLHIGNGASAACIKQGQSVDTSMGLTPLEGLVMGTRSGDMDPALIEFIATLKNISVQEVGNLLNKKSGLKGICGDNDLRAIWKRVDQGDELARKAIELYAYRIRKYVGSYMAVLGRVDAIIFTAGVGENDARTRELVLSGMENLNIHCDSAKNSAHETDFSTQGIPLLTIATNEELEIAEQSFSLL